jgi:antitoxin HicB
MDNLEYRIVIQSLSAEDGGGFIATVPDLPGCVSDGSTPAEALESVRDAIKAWKDRAHAMGRPVPRPRHAVYA